MATVHGGLCEPDCARSPMDRASSELADLTSARGRPARGATDRADEVPLSRKGPKSRKQGRVAGMTAAKGKTRAADERRSGAGREKALKAKTQELEQQLAARTRELAEAQQQQ